MSSITHIVGITHEMGEDQVLNHYEYDAWGNMTVCEETVENRFRFNGQQYDPITQQYYLRARFYNPVVARFTQEDTYRGDGLNLYAYCRNNPVYYEDPSGYLADCMKEAFLEARSNGMSVEEAYAYARDVFEQNHNANRAAQVTISDPNRSMSKDEWKALYRQARQDADGKGVNIIGDPYASYKDFIYAVEALNYRDNAVSNKNAHFKNDSKTIAVSRYGIYTSGWETLDGSAASIINQNVTPQAVMDTYEGNNHKKRGAGFLDHGDRGQYYASHAEKKAAVDSKNTNSKGSVVPIGISSPMCKDCQEYFREEAQNLNQTLYTADPDGLHIFRPDGSTRGAKFSRRR
ncbi:MAG: RHS repeat-associated core domain-containing protein, partial [Lachnospiraceae bacterium]|nr:RHS repeat-associated core domain-containing protein [Lachnospiraceae bacterium]